MLENCSFFVLCYKNFSMKLLLSFLICSFRIFTEATNACVWDLQKSSKQIEREDCGYTCPNPWGKPNPFYCGSPSPCCCAPSCDIEKLQETAFLGINWSDHYRKRGMPRTHQLEILKDSGFKHIKMFSLSGLEDVFRVYGANVSVYVGIPNRDLTALASNIDYARNLVQHNVLPYHSIIKAIIVGNEPFICIQTKDWAEKEECGALGAPAKLLPAMKNMRQALLAEGLTNIVVTTAFNGGIIEMSKNPWTPCVADFKSFLKPLLQPVWHFLREQNAPLIVNIYSWFACKQGSILPDAATGANRHSIPVDGKYAYFANFDMQVDMLRISMYVADLDVWIGETGWPSCGHEQATLANAYVYLENVIRRSQGLYLNDENRDKARFKGVPLNVFLFEAFDEGKKSETEHGNIFENSFGLFYEDGTPKWRDLNGMIKFDINGKNQYVEKPPQPSEL